MDFQSQSQLVIPSLAKPHFHIGRGERGQGPRPPSWLPWEQVSALRFPIWIVQESHNAPWKHSEGWTTPHPSPTPPVPLSDNHILLLNRNLQGMGYDWLRVFYQSCQVVKSAQEAGFISPVQLCPEPSDLLQLNLQRQSGFFINLRTFVMFFPPASQVGSI